MKEGVESTKERPQYAYWMVGFLITLLFTVLVYAIISLFTFLWWTGCIILFIYLWAAITLYIFDAEKQKDGQ